MLTFLYPIIAIVPLKSYDRGMDILDNLSVVTQRDPDGAHTVIADEWRQLGVDFIIENKPDAGTVETVVVAGMGGSALAADLARDWLDLAVPYEVVKSYTVPKYVGERTLFVANSFSGNTEETLSALQEARDKGAQVVVIAKGGKLLDVARQDSLPYIQLSWDYQPRMGMFLHLRALVTALAHFGAANKDSLDEMSACAEWLREETAAWLQAVPAVDNPAKQLASWCAGKTPVIFSDTSLGSIAYKWKISFNENSKNVAYCNELPEFDHNEFTGWTSHPVEKAFAPLNIRSSFEHPRVSKRFELGEQLLSGMKPAAKTVQLQGDTKIAQLLWGCVYADFVSSYLGILNGVNPMRVDHIEKLKKELV